MAENKWVLRLHRIEDDVDMHGPALELTDVEAQDILEAIQGSCLELEWELVWLFEEAGVVCMDECSVCVDVLSPPTESVDDVRKRVADALRAYGVEFKRLD